MPGIPEKPRPPPYAPSERAVADVASASTNVMPSAPVPLSMVAVNWAVRVVESTAVGQNAEPAAFALAGVSCSVGAASEAEPFSCQPPPAGSGTTPAPVRFTVRSPDESVPLIDQPSDCGPSAVGEKRTVSVLD